MIDTRDGREKRDTRDEQDRGRFRVRSFRKYEPPRL